MLILLALNAPLVAQVVTTDPAYPTPEGRLDIFFHADAGDSGLVDFAEPIFAHTGLITNQSAGPADWRFVKNHWGDNDTQIQLERLGANLYRLHIEDIRAYYNANKTGLGPIPSDENILQLALVFRNSDGSRTGRDLGGGDIFIDFMQPGTQIRLVQPQAGPFRPFIAAADTQLVIGARGFARPANLTGLELTIDGQQVAASRADSLEYTLVLDQPGSQRQIQLVASSDDGSADTLVFTALVRSPVVDAAVPQGLVDGINYHPDDPSKATLVLLAPDKDYVYLLGDFNDWQLDSRYLMRRDPDHSLGHRWWIELKDLQPGTQYAFQYLVAGPIRVADPYAEKILDPHYDPALDSPSAYPYGRTEHPVAVLQPGRPTYTWQPISYTRPDPTQLVIYELLLRDFVKPSTFTALAQRLDYLQALGVNAIELMPVAEFDGNLSWGYNPSFYFAPDKYYGTPDQLKTLVEEAHRRGMAVILDVVYNHATGQSPFVRLYNTGVFGAPTADNPWFNKAAPMGAYSFFYDANHHSQATQQWLDRVNRHWLETYHIDGYRFDFTKGFTNRPGDGHAYDPERIALLKRMADQIWDVDPAAYIILEHLAADQEERELAAHGLAAGHPGMLLWNNANHAYSEAIMGYHQDGKADFSSAYFGRGGRNWDRAHLISYMESHDEQWLMFKNHRFGACAHAHKGGPECAPGSTLGYSVRSLPTALQRMELAGAFFFLLPGPKMLWQFGELGYGYGRAGEDCLRPGNGPGDCPPEAPQRTGVKPIHWEYLDDPYRIRLLKTWAALIHLRHAYPVFHDPATRVELDLAGPVKRLHLYHPELTAVIVGNFGVAAATPIIAFPTSETWYDYFSGTPFAVSVPDQSVPLAAGAFHIFTDLPLSQSHLSASHTDSRQLAH